MPELPEVETVVRTLRPHVVGRRVHGVVVGAKKLRRGWQSSWTPAVAGRQIEFIGRRGKWITLGLDTSRLLVHLGMTGQLRTHAVDEPVADHTHLIFDLGDRHLRFRDERRFGSVDYFADPIEHDRFLDHRLGPEPFELDAETWAASLRRTTRPIKAALLDQAVVAGVGNIYADESLFVAGLSPRKRSHRLTAPEAERLRQSMVDVLRHAIERNGSSIRNYLDGTGAPGGYQAEFRVYGRTGEPCRRCGGPIRCTRLAGRSTHDCPRCQPARRGGS